MLQRLSISLVQFFLTEDIITEEDQEVYRYSVEILLSSLVVYGSILLLALWGHHRLLQRLSAAQTLRRRLSCAKP